MQDRMYRSLAWLERAGNRLPDPLSIFAALCAGVILASCLGASLGWTVIHPSTGALVTVNNLLSPENLRRIFTDMVKNFSSFPPLGLVLVTMIGIGVAEKSGLIAASLKGMVAIVPRWMLTAALVFTGVMSSVAADAAHVILPPLGAALFASAGRHPIAGLAAAFAGVSAALSANLLLTALDPLLAGLTTQATQIVSPGHEVSTSSNYYFMAFSTVLLTAVGTWVTTFIVEPRLGEWRQERAPQIEAKLSVSEKRGLYSGALAFLLAVAGTSALVAPATGILRDGSGLKPFFDSLAPLIMMIFLCSGIAFGIGARTIRSDKDVARMAGEAMASMGPYLAMTFVAAQFIAYFSWSNLGIVLSVNGADVLRSFGLTGAPLLCAFIAFTALTDLFMPSASAKWAIMAPIFVPMLLLNGLTPELVQAAYRIGDSPMNVLTPLLPYFPIILAVARKYDPRAGMGSLLSLMLPYSVSFLLTWTLALMAWIGLGIPLGPGPH